MEENTAAVNPVTINSQQSSPASDAGSAPLGTNLEKPKPKFSIAAIIGTILYLLVAGGAAASLTVLKPQLERLVSTPTPTPTIIQTPTPTPGPTEDWKIFTGDGFNFNYPSYAIINETVGQIYINNNKVKPYFSFQINISENTTSLTSLQVLNNELDLLKKNNPNADNLAEYRKSTIKDYEKGDIKGSYMRWGHEGDSVSDAIEIVTANNGKIFIFKIDDGNGSVTNDQQKLLDQILSTFKFTENSAENQLLKEKQDSETRNTLVEFSNANIRYYTTHAGFPWSRTGPCQSSATATPNATSLSQMVPCVSLLIEEGELKGSFLSANGQSISKIFVNSTESKLNICYKPQSIKEQQKPETIYDSFGKVDRSCTSTDNMCFWCTGI